MLFEDWIKKDTKSVLLVEPDFPIPKKSRNHENFLPIGLLKLASYLRSKKIEVKLVRHENDSEKGDSNKLNLPITSKNDFKPDLICVTSIFTYWSKYVAEAVSYYKTLYPKVPVLVGGIYASLLPQHCKEYTKCDDVIYGTVDAAEELIPAYDLVNVDYQIIHTTRGCIRRCGCCGVYEIEPEWTYKKSIKNEIVKKKIIFYDNNLIANPFIKNILNELIELKKKRKIRYIESQSGFDGRILIKKPGIALLLKQTGLKNPKIAWDGPITDAKNIAKQINILNDAGYNAKEISVFMLYNHDLDYEEMDEKRVKCFEWGVQITDCRFRPLNSTFDNYNPNKRKGQTNKDYYIHPNWTDHGIRKFRRNIRRHNICIRHDIEFHSSLLERKKIPIKKAQEYRRATFEIAVEHIPDAWTPEVFHEVDEIEYDRSRFKKYT
ncbi:MAG: cobalamin B12-binding domain-containing protein [Methanobacteriaceae archaeon]|nr:cobalamin B12-binding domain-containing protein [Methanobacteriaceae archaeon]